jgi:hypothetical protein
MDFSKYINDFESDTLYYGDKNFITNSQLGKLSHSPAKLEHYRKFGQEDTSALLFGRAFHQNILEPDKYIEQVIVYEGTRRGKAWEDFKSNNTDKTIITKGEEFTIRKMRDKLLSIPRVINLLSDGKAEVVNCWVDEGSGVYCKGKTDYYKEENGRKILIDIKTTQNHTSHAFVGSCLKYGYDRQSAFYLDGFGADEFWFVVIEKNEPFDVGIYMCGEEFVGRGRSKYKDLLEVYDHYFIKQEREIKDYYVESII